MKNFMILDFSGSFEGGGRKIADDLLNSIAFSELLIKSDVFVFVISSSRVAEAVENVKLIHIPKAVFFRPVIKFISFLKLYLRLRNERSVVYISWGVGPILPSLMWNSISVIHNTIFMESAGVLARFGFFDRIVFCVMRAVLRAKTPILEKIVVSSGYMESLLVRRFRSTGVRSIVTKNFNVSDHRSNHFYSGRERPLNAKIRILSLAAYSEHKCFEELLSGLNLFANRGIGFEFVNYGAKQGGKYWTRLQEELLVYDSLRSRVTFAGAELSRDDIPTRILDADIFLFVSGSESASLALIEASSLGVPIVCPDSEFIEISNESVISRFATITGDGICDALVDAVGRLDTWQGAPYCGLIDAYNRRYCEIFEEVLGGR